MPGRSAGPLAVTGSGRTGELDYRPCCKPRTMRISRTPSWTWAVPSATKPWVTTDLAATPAQVIERYSDRWSEEQAFLDARHLAGVGQARTRTRRSVNRLVPFGLVCLSLAIVWYARHGQPAQDLAAHRARAPWYRTKRTVSVADMLTALRRCLLAAQYLQGHPDQHTLELFPDLLLSQLDPAA